MTNIIVFYITLNYINIKYSFNKKSDIQNNGGLYNKLIIFILIYIYIYT